MMFPQLAPHRAGPGPQDQSTKEDREISEGTMNSFLVITTKGEKQYCVVSVQSDGSQCVIIVRASWMTE